MRSPMSRSRKWLLTAATGSVFALSGCDPTVRDTVLTGVGQAATGLATTFIQAFIESLQAQDDDQTTTVKAINLELAAPFA